jgi:hypothetical protein
VEICVVFKKISSLRIGSLTAAIMMRFWRISLFQESQRAIDIMRCHLPEQRREARIHNPLSGTVSPATKPAETQTVFLRDLNTLGAFFYSNLAVENGEPLAIQLVMPKSGDGSQLKIACEGTVVRVEPGSAGASTGIAVQFSRYDISWLH